MSPAMAVDIKLMPVELKALAVEVDNDGDGDNKIGLSEYKEIKKMKAEADENARLLLELQEYATPVTLLDDLRMARAGVSKVVSKTLHVAGTIMSLGSLGKAVANASDYAKRSLDHKREAFKANQNYQTYDSLVSVCTEELEQILSYAQKRNSYALKAHKTMYALDTYAGGPVSRDELNNALLDPRGRSTPQVNKYVEQLFQKQPDLAEIAEKIAAVTITTKQDDERLFLALKTDPNPTQHNELYDPDQNSFGFWGENTSKVISHVAVVSTVPAAFDDKGTTLQLSYNTPFRDVSNSEIRNRVSIETMINEIDEFLKKTPTIGPDEIQKLGLLVSRPLPVTMDINTTRKSLNEYIVRKVYNNYTFKHAGGKCQSYYTLKRSTLTDENKLYCKLRSSVNQYTAIRKNFRQTGLKFKPAFVGAQEVYMTGSDEDLAPLVTFLTRRAISELDGFLNSDEGDDVTTSRFTAAWAVTVEAINVVLKASGRRNTNIQFQRLSRPLKDGVRAYVGWTWPQGTTMPTVRIVTEFYYLNMNRSLQGIDFESDPKGWWTEAFRLDSEIQQKSKASTLETVLAKNWGVEVTDDEFMTSTINQLHTRTTELPKYVKDCAIASAAIQAAFNPNMDIRTMSPYEMKHHADLMVPVLYWDQDSTTALVESLYGLFDSYDVYALCAERVRPNFIERSANSFAQVKA
ncbi:MAG: hypothetical protein ACPGR8_15330, partial [Limisphaerales bacterium]